MKKALQINFIFKIHKKIKQQSPYLPKELNSPTRHTDYLVSLVKRVFFS